MSDALARYVPAQTLAPYETILNDDTVGTPLPLPADPGTNQNPRSA